MSWTETALGLFPDVLRPVNKILQGRPLSYEDWNHFRYGFQGAKTVKYINDHLRSMFNDPTTTKAYYRQQQRSRKYLGYSQRHYYSRRYHKSKFVRYPKPGKKWKFGKKTYYPTGYYGQQRKFY